jgi:hypothetical protein
VFFASEFHRGDLRWDRHWSPSTESRVALSFGLDRTRLAGSRFSREYPVGLRTEIASKWSDALTVRGGAHGLVQFYNADLPSPYALQEKDYEATVRLFGPRIDTWAGAWIEPVITLPRAIEVTPSTRLDLFGSKGNWEVAVDPRVAVKIPLSEKVSFLTSEGISHQPPAFPIPVPAIQLSGLTGGLQSVVQSTVGVVGELPESMSGSVTLFRNAFRNVGDLFAVGGNSGNDDNDPFQGKNKSLRGTAYGAEFMLRRKFSRRIGGIASYTLSRNERVAGGVLVPNGFDRTHVANLALSVDAGRGWRLGTRLLYYTGVPRIEDTAAALSGSVSRAQGPSRLPAFFRIDGRIEKRWTFKDTWFSIVLEILNATLSKEALTYQCNSAGACKPEEFGPITVPSIGVEGGF